MKGIVIRETPVEGQSYTLFGSQTSTKGYYATVRDLVTSLMDQFPDEHTLLFHLREASGYSSPKGSSVKLDRSLHKLLMETTGRNLSEYTRRTREHLRSLSIRKRLDPVLRTKEYQYHLFMLEIELVNRIYKEPFRKSLYKFSLIAHCLRDFRPGCRSVTGEMERICKACTKDCFIHLGGTLMEKHDIRPYISTTIDMETLFSKLKKEHPDIGALGIACVPELVHGMRLCLELDIPAVGIPLNANRCARWMKETRESSFSLDELEKLLS